MTPAPEQPDRDPVLADAWRAHSSESPPEDLDRRILAAAHRAVGSGPQSAAKATEATEATRPQRWWMPLAAAATIGVVAVGVLQSIPDDHDLLSVTEPMAPKSAAVREQAVAPTDKKDVASALPGRDAAPAADAASAMKKQRADTPAEKAKTGNEIAAAQESKRNAESVTQQPKLQAPLPASVPKLPPSPSPPPPMERESAAGSGKLDAARTQAPATSASTRTQATDAARAPEPFPAAAAPRKSEASIPIEAERGGAAAGSVSSAEAPRSMPSTSQESDARMNARKDAGAERQRDAVSQPRASPPAPPPPMVAAQPQPLGGRAASALAPPPIAQAPAAAAPMRESKEGRDESRAAGGSAATSLAKNFAATDEMRAKARDPDAWIARIRKLRDEGDTVQALRELRDFRSVVPDAERRLPADLREWADAQKQ